jgi:asparagine synthase (glutamine-hydrolysing)
VCGICGFIDTRTGHAADSGVLSAMNAAIVHRGPDDEGGHIDGGVALGSRRLSIIDLAEGHMPMSNEDGSVWVVQNGEIYNFREIRAELEKQGHKFRTHSDTEVILRAYEQHGDDCVRLFNGMFAFAIFDKNRKRLFMARDRVGEKPLHYYWNGSLFVFGSEIKSVLAHPGVPRALDPMSLSKYLTYEYVPAPHSIFKDIRKLEPGYWLALDLDSRTITKGQYWDLPLRDDVINYKSEHEHAEDLLHRLSESVRMRLVSDVPVGVFLSGGIDSSTITALAAKHYPGRIQAFTVSFDDPSFDESPHAIEVAKKTGVNHMIQPCRIADMPALIPDILARMDEPLGDASLVPTYLLSKFAASHVKVVLGGDGGDELFAGYPTYQALKLIRYYNIFPTEVREVMKRVASALPVSLTNISFDFKIKQFLRGAGVSQEVMFFLWMGSFTEAEKKDLLSPTIHQAIGGRNAFEDLFDYIKQSNLKNDLERALYLSVKLYLQDDILVKVDRASMASSLEVRAPFLDHTLIDAVANIPTFFKLNRLKTKYILKKAVEKILPAKIIRRPKKGFGMPVGRWINGELKDLFDDAFSEDRLKRDGVFDPAFVRGLLKEHRALKRDNRKMLWTLFAFQVWRDKWLK